MTNVLKTFFQRGDPINRDLYKGRPLECQNVRVTFVYLINVDVVLWTAVSVTIFCIL